jgi:hypothetical protein
LSLPWRVGAPYHAFSFDGEDKVECDSTKL